MPRRAPLSILVLVIVLVAVAAIAGTIVWGSSPVELASSEADYVVWGN